MVHVISDCHLERRGSVFACMPRKMLSRKLAESEWVQVQCCTATRTYVAVICWVFLIDICRCPCERCTIKIIQSGVKEVVYNLEYKVYVPV